MHPQHQEPLPVVNVVTNIIHDIEYARPNGTPLRLDLYPARDQVRRSPAVVWMHGGGWALLCKENCAVRWLVDHGYTLASIDYRLSGQAPWPAQIHDCKAAIRFIRAHAAEYNIDPARIAVSGSSAGGHLAALMGTSGDVAELEGDLGNPDQSSRVQVAIPICGPTDIMAWHKTGSDDASNAPDSYLSRFLGGPVLQRPEVATAASPVTYVSRDNPPFMVFHGDSDAVVAVSQSDLLVEKLKSAGVTVEYIRVPGVGHANIVDLEKFYPPLLDFLAKHLKSGS